MSSKFGFKKTKDVADGVSPRVRYSGEALRWDLRRVRQTWREVENDDDRFAIYKYLKAVFNLVMVWETEGRAATRAKRALKLSGHKVGRRVEPFAAIIYCTTPRTCVDAKTVSKWSRTLIFAARFKMPKESLEKFVRGHGGINACVAKLGGLTRTLEAHNDRRCQAI